MKRHSFPLILSFLAVSTWIFGASDASTREVVDRITTNVMCICGCSHVLRHCGDECGEAPQLIGDIQKQVADGKLEAEVYQWWEAQYGEKALAVPKAEGFNLVVWVLPFVALVVGAGIVFVVVRQLKLEPAAEATPGTRSPDIDEKYRKILDKELRE